MTCNLAKLRVSDTVAGSAIQVPSSTTLISVISSLRLQNHTRFHWSPLIGKPRIIPVSFVKTTEFGFVSTTAGTQSLQVGDTAWFVRLYGEIIPEL